MSDVKRIKSELALAELAETLEQARDAMHANSNEKTLAAYRAASDEMAAARSSHREKYSTQVGPGDAAPEVDTINVTSGVAE